MFLELCCVFWRHAMFLEVCNVFGGILTSSEVVPY